MGFPWKTIIGASATVLGAMGGPAGVAGAGIVGSILKESGNDDDAADFGRWEKYAEHLRDSKELENGQRLDALRGRIRTDLYKRTKSIPEDRHVNWLAETVVMSIKGDFDDRGM